MSNQPYQPCEVAVIVPCYNAAPHIARALDSVFAQTHRELRAYVIDDGSTDDLESQLRRYGESISLSRQAHAGQASARNRGIRSSDGPFVAFLDADDEWLPHKLERQIEILRHDSRIGMVYSDCLTSGTGPGAGSFFARTGIPKGGRVFERFLTNCGVYTPTVVVRRESLNDVGLFDEGLTIGEDYNMWLRIAARWDVAVIPEALAIRHVSPGSLSLTTSVDTALSEVITAFEHVEQCNPSLSPQEHRALRRAIARHYYEYGSYLLRKGDRKLSQRQMLQAIHHGLRDWRTLAKLGLGFLPYRAFAALRAARQSLAGGSPSDVLPLTRDRQSQDHQSLDTPSGDQCTSTSHDR